MSHSGSHSGSASGSLPGSVSGHGTGTGAKSTLSSGLRIIGQVACDGDLFLEGQIEGGPLRVSGCFTVAPGASAQCADAEVGEALVLGVFQGTLRARDAVRIHQSGRVVGDILAPRVIFVSGPPPTQAAPMAQAAPTAKSVPTAKSTPPAPAPAPVQPAAPAAAPAPRAIPSLPSIGQRAMERKA